MDLLNSKGISEEDIKSYMDQFGVDRNTAINVIETSLYAYYAEQDEMLHKTYSDIVRESY